MLVGLMKQQSTFTFSSELSDAAVRTSFLIAHEIVQKMQLCCKAVKMHHEMSVIVKTVNFIIARGLNHRPFDLFSEIKTFRLAYHTTLKYGGKAEVPCSSVSLSYERILDSSWRKRVAQ